MSFSFSRFMVLLVVLYLGSFVYSSAYAVKVDSTPEICPLHQSQQSDQAIVSLMDKAVSQQDPQPQQPQQPEGDKHCERPNKDGSNPDVGGTDKNKIGCGCVRKCVEGRPTEDYQNGVRCKVHCKPDNCDCPNPCAKT